MKKMSGQRSTVVVMVVSGSRTKMKHNRSVVTNETYVAAVRYVSYLCLQSASHLAVYAMYALSRIITYFVKFINLNLVKSRLLDKTRREIRGRKLFSGSSLTQHSLFAHANLQQSLTKDRCSWVCGRSIRRRRRKEC
jgi:hypothetical protein